MADAVTFAHCTYPRGLEVGDAIRFGGQRPWHRWRRVSRIVDASTIEVRRERPPEWLWRVLRSSLRLVWY